MDEKLLKVTETIFECWPMSHVLTWTGRAFYDLCSQPPGGKHDALASHFGSSHVVNKVKVGTQRSCDLMMASGQSSVETCWVHEDTYTVVISAKNGPKLLLQASDFSLL